VDAVRGLARRIAGLAGKGTSARRYSVAGLVALAHPDRIAKRRDAKGENWITAIGRGLRLDPTSPLASSEWLAVADMQGAASGARIMSAVPISETEVLALFADRIETVSDLRYDKANDRIEARMRRRLGAIVLVEGQLQLPDSAQVAETLLRAVTDSGLDLLPWSETAKALRQRAAFAGEMALSDQALLASAGQWLLPLLAGVSRLRDISRSGLSDALDNMLGWDGKQRVDRIAPANFTSPAGTTHAIDYAAEAGPTVELRVQALFGLDTHPVVGADRMPLVLSLTSPAGRPIQTTRNLPEFWRGSWREVAKEMRGRYPKHNWPDAPWESVASLKTKKAQAREA
jgi:ATP-dependent helicase HrpB